MRIWVGAAAADAGLRLVLQLASTVIVSRILTAAEFGLATIVLTIVATLGVFIGLPFEESLAQRRRLRRAHLETALFVSLVVAGVAALLALAIGPMLETAADVPGLAQALFVASLFLLAQGPAAIARAVSRRHRAFVDLAACQALATALACGLAVVAALLGFGVYALIVQRLLPVIALPLLIVAARAARGFGVRLAPRWHPGRLSDIGRFASFHLADLCLSTLKPMILAFLVNGLLGTAQLGQFNIALRMVEPLRAGIFGIYHNLAFSVLVARAQDGPRLVLENGRIVAALAAVIVPLFAGLAVTAPLVIPFVMGPGWEAAVPLAQILCIATAAALPLELFFTGFSALGRPEYGVGAAAAGLGAMLLGFAAAPLVAPGLAPGFAFLAQEAAVAAVGLLLALRIVGAALGPSLGRLGRILLAAAVMSAVVALAVRGAGQAAPGWVLLLGATGLGTAAYCAALLVLCRACLEDLLRLAPGGRRRT